MNAPLFSHPRLLPLRMLQTTTAAHWHSLPLPSASQSAMRHIKLHPFFQPAEPERVFSGAKITLSDRRCSLGDEAINALECLKSWHRDGLISAHHEEIQQLENTLDALCQAEMEWTYEQLDG
jgi:hypothetical protein